MHRSIVLPFILILPCITSHAQQWVEMLNDDARTVHEVKAAFDAHWLGQPYSRGKGWKQFQRWHWFMEQRTWPSGERLDPAVQQLALEELAAMRASRGGERDDAVWEPLGPATLATTSYNPGNGRVNVVAVDPQDPNALYVGTPSSGIWRSPDHGASWAPLFTDLPSMGVSGIAIDTTGTGIIYIATGDGDAGDTYSAGVLKSTDDGQTWNSTGLNWSISQSRTTRTLRMDPTNPLRLYCSSSNGLYRTLDGAVTWLQVSPGDHRDVELKPGDPSQLYACTDRFYRSVSGGEAFTASGITGLPSADSVGRMAIAVCEAAPEVVYVLCSNQEDNSFLGLWRSDDAGLTFTLRSSSPNIFSYSEDGSGSGGQAWYDMALAVDATNPDVVYVGGINVWKSEDGGETWDITSHWVYPAEVGYTHADIHALEVINGKVYCGSDGGFFASEDGAEEWNNLSHGLDIMQFYRMGSSELLPELIVAGAQDNGSNRWSDGSWTHVLGADGMEAAVDPFDPGTIYCSSQNGGLNRSDNGGNDWISLVNDMFEEGAWVTPYALDPQVPGRMLAGFNNLLYSEDQGQSWVDVTGWETDQFVRCLAFAPSNSDVWYVARNDKVARLEEQGWVQVNIRPGLPGQSPTSFAVDPEDAMHVWVSFSGQSAPNKVFESLDGGLAWVNRSSGLPNVPVNSIVAQPLSPNGVYVGTDLGVFYRDDYSNGWVPYGTGMPNVVVSELEINMTSGKLRAATYGRGIWQADLYFSPFASVPEAGAQESPRVFAVDGEGRFQARVDPAHGTLRRIAVRDAAGRTIMDQRSNDGLIDLSGAARAAYVVELITDQGSWSQRVMR